MQKAVWHGGPTQLGSYEIVRPLARGGMAELFLARVAGLETFEKLVVVKKILPKFADNPRFLQLFLDEAKLAASLSHENIVSVHDAGGTASESFFAMEYLHGQDVRTILHRSWKSGEKLPIAHAVQIARAVALALHYAHEKRRPDGSLLEIVHRDVSPSNVIVTYDGTVKLIDFGVAKAATRTVKTRTGTLKGKIAYMSPEQAKGAHIDRRSDVFSLGIVLWEMITTSRLFRGENDLATLQLIVNNPIKKPTADRPDCPPELERIVLKALSQDVARRYQTANELAQDLEDLVRAEQLSQSAAGLSAYMHDLFRHELDSWEEARGKGMALGEHLTNVGELTTPISESDFVEAIDSIDLEDDEEPGDDESLGAISGTIDPPTMPATVPGRRVATPPSGIAKIDRTPPPQFVRPPPRPSAPALVVAATARADATATVKPLPAPTAAERGRADVTPVPQAGRGDATALVAPLPAPERPSSPWSATPTPHGGIAQGSWPQSAHPVSLGESFSPEQAQRLKKQFLWAGGALVALVLLVAFVKAAGGGDAKQVESGSSAPAVVEPPARGSAGQPAVDGEGAARTGAPVVGEDDPAPRPGAVGGNERGERAADGVAPSARTGAPSATDVGGPESPPTNGQPVGAAKPAGGQPVDAAKPAAGQPTPTKAPPKKVKRPTTKRPVRKFDPNAPLPPR